MFRPMNKALFAFRAMGAFSPSLQGSIFLAKGVVGIAQLQQKISQVVVTVISEWSGFIRHGCQQLHHLPMLTAMAKAYR